MFVTRAPADPRSGRTADRAPGRVVRLDARRSRATRRQRGLSYRWQLVERPKGSRARLRGVHRARPRLRPDKAGRYKVRLVVLERPGPGARSSAASPRSVDVATIAAAPYIPPIGVPIDTVAPQGVTLGAPLNQSFPAPDPTQALQLVVLDRSDLSLVSNQSYGGDDNGTGDLLSAVNALGSGSLAIILSPFSHDLQEIAADDTAEDNLNSALSAIGAPTVAQYILIQQQCDGNCSNLSAIGVPGTSSGGTVNPSLRLAPNGDSAPSTQADLRGYLQLDSFDNYTYVNGDYMPFNTVAPGTTPRQAVITVGGDTYNSQELPAGQAGFFVLVLDAGRGKYRNIGTFAVNGVDAATAASNLIAMDSMLETAAGYPTALTFIQTIGAVARVDVAQWNLVAGDQTKLGGHGYYLNALDGGANSSYAFVGPGDAETYLSPYASDCEQPRDGRARPARRPPGPEPEVAVVSQGRGHRPDAGPRSRPATRVLAHAAVAREGHSRAQRGHRLHRRLPAARARRSRVEDNYTDDSVDWDSNQTQVSKFTFAGLSSQCQQSFSADDLSDVESQLTSEWAYMPTVEKLVQNLQMPLLGGLSTFQAHVADVFHDIERSVTPPSDSTTAASAAQITVDVLWIASYIPEVGDAFGLLAGFGQLALDTSNDSNGTPEGDSFDASPTELPDELADRLQTLYTEMDSVEDILVSDWGKLSTAAQKAVTDWQWMTASTTVTPGMRSTPR